MAPAILPGFDAGFDKNCIFDAPHGCRVYWEDSGRTLRTVPVMPYKGMPRRDREHDFVVLKKEFSAHPIAALTSSGGGWKGDSVTVAEGDHSRWIFTAHCSEKDLFFISSLNYVRQSSSDCDFMLCHDAITGKGVIKRMIPRRDLVTKHGCWWRRDGDRLIGNHGIIASMHCPEFDEEMMQLNNGKFCEGKECRAGEICAKTDDNHQCRCLSVNVVLHIPCP